MTARAESRLELTLGGQPHRQGIPTMGNLVYLREPQKQFIRPVLFDGQKLPFRDDSVTVATITPRRNSYLTAELNRVSGHTEDNPLPAESKLEITPIIGSIIKTWKEWRKGERGAAKWRNKFAEEIFEEDMIPSIEELDNFIQKMNEKGVNGVIVNQDYFLVAFLRSAGARLLNFGLSTASFAVTGDLLNTGITAATLEIVLPALVEDVYVAYRYYTNERNTALEQRNSGVISEAEYKNIEDIYRKLYLVNFIILLPYTWSLLISTGTNSSISKELISHTLIKSAEKFKLDKVAEKLRQNYRESLIPQSAYEAREQLTKSPYPILTAAIVGGKNGFALSRAHRTDPEDFSHIMKDTLPFVDITEHLPMPDFKKMMRVGKNGRRVARSDILHDLHENLAPYLRRFLDLEGNMRATVSFFMDELVKTRRRPITTFHYAVGNSAIEYLLEKGITDVPVIHYITDPAIDYVHDNYLDYKDVPFVQYFVFDEGTKAKLIKEGVNAEKIFVTGLPLKYDIETNFTSERLNNEYRFKPQERLRVGVFTGGLGSNQGEIMQVAKNLDYKSQQAVFYCGTNVDLAEKLIDHYRNRLIKENINVIILTSKDKSAKLEDYKSADAIIIVDHDLNDIMPLSYEVLKWSQIVCSKPSPDIAVEAMMSGKIVSLFKNWGRHEGDIRRIIRKTMGGLDYIKGESIGAYLKAKYESGDLFNQAAKLWGKLNVNPPFPYDWKKRSLKALLEIEALYESRRKYVTVSVRP